MVLLSKFSMLPCKATTFILPSLAFGVRTICYIGFYMYIYICYALNSSEFLRPKAQPIYLFLFPITSFDLSPEWLVCTLGFVRLWGTIHPYTSIVSSFLWSSLKNWQNPSSSILWVSKTGSLSTFRIVIRTSVLFHESIVKLTWLKSWFHVGFSTQLIDMSIWLSCTYRPASFYPYSVLLSPPRGLEPVVQFIHNSDDGKSVLYYLRKYREVRVK